MVEMYVKYFLTVLLLSQLYEAKGELIIFNITCDPSIHSSQDQCTSDTLETIAANVSAEANATVQINIKIPILHLNANISFANLDLLTIRGEHNITEIACSGNSSAGLVLSKITHISLQYLKLSYCGSQTIATYDKMQIFSSAVTINSCRNVEVHQIILERSRGIGLSIIYHQGGKVNITSSAFRENKLPLEYIESELVWGGGGIYIFFNEPTLFHLENCIFENNTSHTRKEALDFTNALGEEEVGYGRGGGVHVTIRGGVKGVHITFSNCQFLANKAYFGGGLSVIQKITMNNHEEFVNGSNSVLVKNSLFRQNGCSHKHNNDTQLGGGVHFYIITKIEGTVKRESYYLFKNVSFVGNCANVGGATHYHSYCSYNGKKSLHHIRFDHCIFRCNRAHIGSAVNINPKFLSPSSDTCTAPSLFQTCNFTENKILVSHLNSTAKQKTFGLGTLFSVKQEIHFKGENHFHSNYGSAIYTIDSLLNFTESNASFVNNTGIHGGAMVFIGESSMIVGSHDYLFINNTAINRGGAVYVQLMDGIDFVNAKSKQCFIEYDDDLLTFSWNSNIIFSGNKAIDDVAGHSIYATSLHPCQVIANGTKNNVNYEVIKKISDVFTARGIRFHDDNNRHQIATDGDLFHTSNPNPLKIIPGEMYKHGVTLTDELGQIVTATLRVAVTGSEYVQLISGTSQYIGSEIQLRGKPDHRARLLLHAVLSEKKSFIDLEVVLLDCPPGFKLNDNLVCVCNIDAYTGLYKCDQNNFHSYLHPGYWAGLLKTQNGKSQLVTTTCPYCDHRLTDSNTSDFEFGIRLPKNISKLDEKICGDTRTGVLCGKCREGHTVHFHSPSYLCKLAEPVGCKLGWLYYIVSELIPVTIIFITVLTLNISFTSGSVNGFILFSQLLDTWSLEAHGIIVYPEPMIYKWIQGYQVIYGFFNIDFFTSESLSFCLWKDASALDVLSVKYITILYSMLLILAVIWIMNNCGSNWPCKYCRITTVRTSVIHGISTFLVMCYAQCIKVSLFLLTPAYIFREENSKFYPPPRVWLDGEVIYFSKEHLPYALPALICLLVVGLLPPLLLLGYPLLNKIMMLCGYENIRVVKLVSRSIPTSKFKPLLDSIQGCFKDNMRFFAGLYFLYRWAILLIHMRADNFSIYYVAVGFFLLFILILHTICQPYIKRAHNIIDALVIANLVLLNFLSYFNYQISRGRKDSEFKATVSPSVIQLLLIYIPLVVMAVHILLKLCRNYQCRSLVTSAFSILIPTRAQGLRQMVQNFSSNDEDLDTNWEEFIHDRLLNNTAPYPKYSCSQRT